MNQLSIAIYGNDDDVKSLDELKELAKKYNATFSDWKTTANENDTSMKKKDKASIEGRLPEGENVDRVAQDITEASVTELKTRLVNIKRQLTTVIDAIDSLKYGNTRIVDIKDFATFKSKTATKVSPENIPLKNGSLST